MKASDPIKQAVAAFIEAHWATYGLRKTAPASITMFVKAKPSKKAHKEYFQIRIKPIK